MPLVPATLTSSINSSRTAKGVNIDSAVKAVTSSLPPSSVYIAGQKAWQTALKVIYADLDTNLATNIGTFLNSMTVTYSGVPSVAIVPPPTFLFSSKAETDGLAIDSLGKSRASSLPPSSIAMSGQIMQQSAFEIIYQGLPSIAANAISLALAGASSIVPPGVACLGVPSPGVTVSPSPALVIPTVWSVAALTGLLTTAFNTAKAKATGTLVDSTGKGLTASLPPSAVGTAGQKIWEVFSQNLTLDIATIIPDVLKTFLLTGSASVFNVAPGTPISFPAPPFSGTAGPAPQPLGIIT